SSCTARTSAPPCSRCVAYEWRRVWGLIGSGRSLSSAASAARCTTCQAACLVSRVPREPRKIAGVPVPRAARTGLPRVTYASRARQGGPGGRGVRLGGLEGESPPPDHAVLVPLAAQPGRAVLGVDVVDVEPGRLGDPRPEPVEHLEQRPVAQRAGGGVPARAG